MVNTLSLQKWSNISATPTAFTLRGGLYALTVHAANWSSFATGTLAFATNPTDADTVTLGSITYRFKGTMAQANDVKLESTAAATLAHLVKAINATGIAGTDYYTGTTINTKASAAISTTNLVATALTAGDNTVTSTQSITGGTDTWGAATLGGGGTAGSVTLQRLAPDNSTYATALTTMTADAFATAQLPSGTYKLTVANSSAIYADLVAIDEPV
jgi:hypothetical protein